MVLASTLSPSIWEGYSLSPGESLGEIPLPLFVIAALTREFLIFQYINGIEALD
jgi:hypothetical protein